jgi:uncharacterized surface protein with fasciclin (FAS1) repeats
MHKIYNKVLGLALAALTFTACSDTWGDHYEGTAANMNEGSLWEAIQKNPNLSNFAEVIKATGYDRQLNSSQTFTVFAPTNDKFTSSQAQALINKFNQEKLSVKDIDNSVLKEFVKNHIALYNYSTSANSADSVRLLNGKYAVLQTGEVNGVKTLTQNQLFQNGVLFTVDGQIGYLPNIFEYIQKDRDLDSIANFLYNPSFYYKEFMPNLSVVDSVSNGKTVYMDSVLEQRNRLFQHLQDISSEDSTYWMVMPTNTVWKQLVDEYKTYFNYADNVQLRDSMNYVNTRLAVLQGTIFSKTYNKGVFTNQTSSTTLVSDSALSEQAVQAYHNRKGKWGKGFNYYEYLNAWRSGGVFDQTDNVTCSNGMVRKATNWPINKLETFVRYRIIEAESGDIWEYSKIPNPKVEGDSIQTISPIIRDVVPNDSINFYDKVWNNQYMEFDVQESSYMYHSVTYSLKNVLSNVPYDIYLVTTPALAHNINASEFERRPVKVRCTLYYPKQDGKQASEQLVSSQATTADQIDYIAVNASKYPDGFIFPVSNYNLDEESPSVKLKIETRVTSGDYSKNFSRTMRIDCILLVPHGTLDLSDPSVVKMTPHGDYNGLNLRSWEMKR